MKRSKAMGLATGLAILLLAGGQLAAQGRSSAPPPVSVTSTVFDTDAFGNATLVQGDDPIAGSATYVAGDGGVISQIDTSDVDWNLDLRSSSRGFYLTLKTAAGGAVPGFPTGAIFYSGRIVSRCWAPTTGGSLYSWFNISDDPNCSMVVDFTSASTKYTLVMSPGYTGTGLASVHCNATNGGSCADWTVIPNANAANAGVANLYSITKNGSEQFVAACLLTFRMHVRVP